MSFVRQLLVIAFFACLAPASQAAPVPDHVRRVLFIGNSLTYTNNLPGILWLIAGAQRAGPRYEVRMLARGGATVASLVNEPALLDALATNDLDAVVLQERGGDVLCLVGPNPHGETCRGVSAAHGRLAALAKAQGARVFILGTYQFAPEVSKALVRGESVLAASIGASHVEVSETLRRARDLKPEMPWLHRDGGHPGIATTMLMAVRLYEALTGRVPDRFRPCTSAPLWGPDLKRTGLLGHVDIVAEGGVQKCVIGQPDLEATLALASSASQGPATSERSGE